MSRHSSVEDEIRVRDYIHVLIRRKKIFFIILMSWVIITSIVCYLIPNIYEVSLTLEPPVLRPSLVDLEFAEIEASDAVSKESLQKVNENLEALQTNFQTLLNIAAGARG